MFSVLAALDVLGDPLVALPGFGALAATAYVFLKVVNSDRNYESLIDSLKSEIERKDGDIVELVRRVDQLARRVSELEFFEYVERSLRDHIADLEKYIRENLSSSSPVPPPPKITLIKSKKTEMPPPPPAP